MRDVILFSITAMGMPSASLLGTNGYTPSLALVETTHYLDSVATGCVLIYRFGASRSFHIETYRFTY